MPTNRAIVKRASSYVDHFAGDSGISEAPLDNQLYGRQNSAWTQVPPPGIAEAPLDGQPYARQNAAWRLIDATGPWQTCTYPPGCSGPLYARNVGDPQLGIIQIIGQASATTSWDASYNFILAYLPAGLAPNGDRFALVPSSYTPGTPDSISCIWVKATGDIAIAFIYEKGPNPIIAWFNTVTIQK